MYKQHFKGYCIKSDSYFDVKVFFVNQPGSDAMLVCKSNTELSEVTSVIVTRALLVKTLTFIFCCVLTLSLMNPRSAITSTVEYGHSAG